MTTTLARTGRRALAEGEDALRRGQILNLVFEPVTPGKVVHLPYSDMVHRHLAPTGPCEENRPMTNRTMSRLQDESDAVTCDELKMAIEHQGLELYYQPLVDLGTERLRGFEALVRFSHPTLGVIPAADFVPLAEKCGLIWALDDWVLLTACEQLAVWQADELVGLDFDLAINVSGSEANGSTLGSRLQRAIAATGANPARLVVEITESQEGEPHASARSVTALHDLGVRVALDDFGMSFATFSRLRSLDFDIVKIDRSLTSVISTELGQRFLRLVVNMCHEKGSTNVAEGIETGQQARLATELGCDLGQGYLWSHALPAPKAKRLLVAGKVRRSASCLRAAAR